MGLEHLAEEFEAAKRAVGDKKVNFGNGVFYQDNFIFYSIRDKKMKIEATPQNLVRAFGDVGLYIVEMTALYAALQAFQKYISPNGVYKETKQKSIKSRPKRFS